MTSAIPGSSSKPVMIGEAGEGAVEMVSGAAARSSSIVPLIVLFQRAWELAQSTETSLGRLNMPQKPPRWRKPWCICWRKRAIRRAMRGGPCGCPRRGIGVSRCMMRCLQEKES